MLQKVAADLNVAYDKANPSKLCENPQVQSAVLTSFKEEAKKAGLTSLETVVGVCEHLLLPSAFTYILHHALQFELHLPLNRSSRRALVDS